MGKMSKWRRDKAVPSQEKPKPIAPMRMQIEPVGPEQALRWLAVNQANRPISEILVKRYAEDMKHGRWKTTHQGIAFDQAGMLLDGQHRLKAIIKASITLQLVIFRDCDRATFDRLDAGRKRTAADALAVDGIDNARAVAAIARSIIIFGFKESDVTDAFVVEFAREREEELIEYVPLVPMLTAPGAAAFAFAATDANLRPAVRRLLDNLGGQEIDDLRRCIKLMSSGIGTASQRIRYKLVMDAILRAGKNK